MQVSEAPAQMPAGSPASQAAQNVGETHALPRQTFGEQQRTPPAPPQLVHSGHAPPGPATRQRPGNAAPAFASQVRPAAQLPCAPTGEHPIPSGAFSRAQRISLTPITHSRPSSHVGIPVISRHGSFSPPWGGPAGAVQTFATQLRAGMHCASRVQGLKATNRNAQRLGTMSVLQYRSGRPSHSASAVHSSAKSAAAARSTVARPIPATKSSRAARIGNLNEFINPYIVAEKWLFLKVISGVYTVRNRFGTTKNDPGLPAIAKPTLKN